MVLLAGVREAESWSPANVVGGLLLLAVLAVLAVWLVRRYLNG